MNTERPSCSDTGYRTIVSLCVSGRIDSVLIAHDESLCVLRGEKGKGKLHAELFCVLLFCLSASVLCY